MRKLIYTTATLCLFLVSCSNKPTLQQYFVAHQDQPNFVSIDVAPSILNLDKSKLTSSESKALASFEKMNVLAYKVDDKNRTTYKLEKDKLVEILKDTVNYHQLMKFGSGAQGASISFVGNENHIDEFVLFGNKNENGFAVVRILGNDMKPEQAMTLFSILQKSNIDSKQFDVLKDLMK